YVVSNAVKIYGWVFVYGLVCVLAFVFCIVLVYRLLTDLIRWQDKTNRKLKEAADAAIAAGKAKSSFLAQMSHEIRTPINAVLGMNEMILRESESRDIKDYAANIQSAGRTLLSLINSILDFSKIEDGKMELVPVKYDMPSLINDLINSISERARAKGLDFELHADGTLPCTLFGDDVRIRQVIMNLLTNAVKYTERGKVTLSVEGKDRKEDSITLLVSVKDTGIGIKEEDMGKLFESFERLEETRNRNIEGTGLGMSIVTKLLNMMNSELWVDSVYGEGSEFSFALVQKVISNEPIGDFSERLKNSFDQSEEETYLVANEAQILVVDDNEMNRKVARSLMKRNGIVPDEAASGEEAIAQIRKNEYDIVFLDHMMPKMDGIETLKRLRKEDWIPRGCVVIALTANATSGARERYLAAGFDDYLSKPIEVVQLEKKLEAWLPEEKVEWKRVGGQAKAEEKPVEDRMEFAPKEDVLEFEPKEEALEFAPEEEGLEFEPGQEVFEFSPAEDEGSAQSGGSTEGGETDWDAMLAALREQKFDVEIGLGFCGQDVEFYVELLSDFVEAYADKKQELDVFFEAENWHDFEVKIHALKSSAKSIGASALADRAFFLERAAADLDAKAIQETYPVFDAEYLEMVQGLKRVL
ncbi:MAG: response regulator, partial [Lachnospiraceae bacterium]|nr:response regulator [Lachnospiraceae bacterium]